MKEINESQINIVDLADTSVRPKHKLKVIVVGDSGVGKTNIITSYIKNEFSNKIRSTVTVELLYKIFKINDEVFRVDIWDTAGQEKYRSISTVFFKDAIGAVVVYDTTDRISFNNIKQWIQDVKANANKDVRIIIVGNKSDKYECRKVETEEGEKLANDLGCLFIEASACNRNNIDNIFNLLLKDLYKYALPKIKDGKPIVESSTFLDDSQVDESLVVNDKKDKKSSKNSCC